MEGIQTDYKGLTASDKYELLLSQVPALMDDRVDWVANSANLCASLKEAFGWFWVGVYRKVSEEYLQLGPFQGPVACTFIQKGKGVCGTVWQNEKSELVPDVDKFPGHIACSSLSKSEIVVPIYKENTFWGVLDIDSDKLNDFTSVDLENIESLVKHFEKFI